MSDRAEQLNEPQGGTTDTPGRIKVVAVVAGGVVQAAWGNRSDIAFEVLDHDNFKCEQEIDGKAEDEAMKRLSKECPHAIF